MTTDQGGTGRPEDQGQRKGGRSAFDALKDDEDRNVLLLWRENSILLDQRYESKALLKLVTGAMTDEQIRSRLVNDSEGFLRGLQGNIDLPEGTTLRFFENTQDTLNVVLPPPAGGMVYSRSGEMSFRAPELRDALRSRTSPTSGAARWADHDPIFTDDMNVGDLGDWGTGPGERFNWGDEDYRDY